jgi:hypothetical protein
MIKMVFSAKEFRPISLTPFLPKTLEKLVDEFLKTGALVKHPLAASQYAHRPGRSTETITPPRGQRGETARSQKYAIGTFLDIEGHLIEPQISQLKKPLLDMRYLKCSWTGQRIC